MILNPLDMHGPQFLFFYLFMGATIWFMARTWIRRQELKNEIPKLNLDDPYEIAFLRGGEAEAIRIATVSLIERGLLTPKDDWLMTKSNTSLEQVRRPLEKAILQKCATSKNAADLLKDASLLRACDPYRFSLNQKYLIASDTLFAERLPVIVTASATLLGLAGLKIMVAISRGRFNIGFLILLAGLFLFALYKLYKRERTYLGDRMLSDLRTLFARLHDRKETIRPNGEANTAAILAAVFGLGALTNSKFSFLKPLFPKASSTNNSSCNSGCSSSCSSSCGGGCGGGCGGCGS